MDINKVIATSLDKSVKDITNGKLMKSSTWMMSNFKKQSSKTNFL